MINTFCAKKFCKEDISKIENYKQAHTKEVKIKLSPFQKDFLDRADENLLILVTGVGAGKTRAAALWVVYVGTQKKTRIIAAAQNFKALAEVLFREIEKILLSLNVQFRYVKGQKFILQNGTEIFGATAEKPTSILGFSDIEYAIIDEAAYCPEELYNYITDRMRGENIKQGKVRLISSPSSQVKFKWFKDLCKKYPNKVIRATTFDNKFTSDEYKRAQVEKYGEGTPLYKQQILGEFIGDNYINQIVTNSDFANVIRFQNSEYTFGIDCAGYGVDYNVIAVSNKAGVVEIIRKQQADTFELASIVRELAEKYKPKRINLDAGGGYSNGLYDTLKLTCRCELNQINFAGKPKSDQCANIRAEMYLDTAKAIKEGFYIKDEQAREELIVTQYFLNNSGKSAIIPKEEIKKIIGRSPDTADSIVLSLYNPNEEIELTPQESLNIAMKFVGI